MRDRRKRVTGANSHTRTMEIGPGGSIRGEVRLRGYRRVSHGLYVPTRPGEPPSARRQRDLAAYTMVLPPDAGFTHITAAGLREWALPLLPDLAPVFAAGPTAAQPRRGGLIYSRLAGLGAPQSVAGVPVVGAAETLLRAARDLALLDLVAMLDSALHLGHVPDLDLAEAIASGRPGARRLRTALSWADARAESPFESLLRLYHEFAGIHVEPQLKLLDEQGRERGRADLWLVGTNLLHEYDGEGHAQRRQRTADLRRQRWLAGTPYVRQGFVAEDLLDYPLTTLQEIDRAIGRRHRPHRLARWRRELALSSYSVTGRQRLLNRWLAYPGFGECAKTA